MSERPFMQLYVSDYLGDTRHLSCEQHGAYLLLLMTMWNAGGALPDDDFKLARIVCLSVKKWRSIRADIVPFFTIENGSIMHNRLSKELQKSESKSQSRASAGAEGGRAKALKDKEARLANAIAKPQHLPDTITIKKEKTLGASAPEPEWFAEFWIAYPRREGPNPRKPAKLAFDRLVAKGVDPQRLIDAAKALAVEHPTPTRFIPQAVTWLNQERWDEQAPLITGNDFCPEDWTNTRFLVARFKQENQTDPPRAVQGGKAGYLIPAEWVAISKQQRAANA